MTLCGPFSFASPVAAQFDSSQGKAATDGVPILRTVGVEQHLDAPLPLDASFSDENGHDVTLREYVHGKPIVLVFAYYHCPMLCTMVLQSALTSIGNLRLVAGRDFEFVVVGIDPSETPAVALAKKQEYLRQYRRVDEVGFHFLTGRESSIERLANVVGFRYAFDAQTQQYAHPAMITVVTSGGRISRYLFGISFPEQELRLSLVEASAGSIGGAADQALLYCYHFDPSTGRYAVNVPRLLRWGGAATIIGMALFLGVLRRRRDSALTRS
jgi:protein SCO1/2